MGSLEWGCCARLAASRPGLEPPAITFLNHILPSEQVSKQAGPGGGPGQAQQNLCELLALPAAPRRHPVITYKEPWGGAPGREAAWYTEKDLKEWGVFREKGLAIFVSNTIFFNNIVPFSTKLK